MAKNDFIKKPNSLTEYTPEQAKELALCAADPVYFIKNYCYIQNQIEGLILFKLRLYQERIVRSLHKNRFNILLIGRQSGKCFSKATTITVCSKPIGIKKFLLKVFFPIQYENMYNNSSIESSLCRFKRNFLRFLLDAKEITIENLASVEDCKITDIDNKIKFIGQKELTDIFVETPTGFSKVKKLLKTIQYKEYELKLANNKSLICADDHLLIDSNGIQRKLIDLSLGDFIQTTDGISQVTSKIESSRSSNMYDLELADDQHVFYTNGILSHNTETTAAYAYWFAIFHEEKNVLVASNKQRGAADIMNRIRSMYEHTPDFLRPGAPFYNRGSIEFDNGSRIWSEATTESTGRGKSIALFIGDELAHVKTKIQNEMWPSLFLTISTGGSCVIMSTPNGDSDLFANLWRGAVSNTNGFVPIEVKVDEVPGRDEVWQKMMSSKIGEIKFRQEFCNEFLSSEALLINSLVLSRLTGATPAFIDKGFYFWKDPAPEKTYIVGVDVAEGTQQDFSTIQVVELDTFTQIAEFRSNTVKEHQLYEAIKYVITKLLSYTGPGGKRATVYWSFENNSAGAALGALYYNDEKFPDAELISGAEGKLGMRTVNKTKVEACRMLKKLVEQIKNGLNINSKMLIFELKNFIATGAGYNAKHGATDDLICAMLIVLRIIKMISEYEPQVFDKLYKSDGDFYDEVTNDYDEPMPFVV